MLRPKCEKDACWIGKESEDQSNSHKHISIYFI